MSAYKVNQVATLSGVSVRALRHYDEIGRVLDAGGFDWVAAPKAHRTSPAARERRKDCC